MNKYEKLTKEKLSRYQTITDIDELKALLKKAIQFNQVKIFDSLLKNKFLLAYLNNNTSFEYTSEIYAVCNRVRFLRKLTKIGFNFESVYSDSFVTLKKIIDLNYLSFFVENNYGVNHNTLYKLMKKHDDIEYIKLLSKWDNFIIFINNYDHLSKNLSAYIIDDILILKEKIKIQSRKEKIKQLRNE